ncbi:hypothetical protein J6590_005680 [Homalodisca vitripennis]|nr:hypothetical protein J6590_005680 [Homalodisca vitripennis]
MSHVLTEYFTKDDTMVMSAGANDLSDVTAKNKQPARVLGSEGNQHGAWEESRGGGSRDGGRVIVGETFFTQHGQHINRMGKLVLSDMIAVAAQRLRLAPFRHPTIVVGLRPGLASRISSSAKSHVHERLCTPSPTNCLQHESYASVVRSTPRTRLRSPAAVVDRCGRPGITAAGGAPSVSAAGGSHVTGHLSVSSRSPVTVQLLPRAFLCVHFHPT